MISRAFFPRALSYVIKCGMTVRVLSCCQGGLKCSGSRTAPCGGLPGRALWTLCSWVRLSPACVATCFCSAKLFELSVTEWGIACLSEELLCSGVLSCSCSWCEVLRHLPFLRCVGCWPGAACDAVWGGTHVWCVSTPLQPHTTHSLQLQAVISVPLPSGRWCLLCVPCHARVTPRHAQGSHQARDFSQPLASSIAVCSIPPAGDSWNPAGMCPPIVCLLCSLHTHSITGWHSAVPADSCALPCCPCAVMPSMQHTGRPVVYCLCLCVHSITCRGLTTIAFLSVCTGQLPPWLCVTLLGVTFGISMLQGSSMLQVGFRPLQWTAQKKDMLKPTDNLNSCSRLECCFEPSQEKSLQFATDADPSCREQRRCVLCQPPTAFTLSSRHSPAAIACWRARSSCLHCSRATHMHVDLSTCHPLHSGQHHLLLAPCTRAGCARQCLTSTLM